MINREARTTFANISKLYDKARISYPQTLINDIIDFSNLKKGDMLVVELDKPQFFLLKKR